MQNTYLQHHGILGQKWGKKNGPPYPLNASDKSYAEREAGHNIKVKDVKNNMDYLSDQELQRAINRINMQNQVTQLAKNKNIISRGVDAADGVLKKGNNFIKDAFATAAWIGKISALL